MFLISQKNNDELAAQHFLILHFQSNPTSVLEISM